MQIDLFFVSVDGSLANPRVAAAVALWSAILSALALSVVRAWPRSRRGAIGRSAIFAAGAWSTDPAQRLIGGVPYWLDGVPEIVSVCFIGGPPALVAPTVACVAGVSFAVYRHFRARPCPPTPASSPTASRAPRATTPTG